MNKRLQEQLSKYQEAEANGIRKIFLKELSEFVSMLLDSADSEYRTWVYELSKQVIDRKSGFPIRAPLFEQVIFPILYEGFKLKEPNTARWLAGFSQNIYESKSVRNKLGENYAEIYFLRRALEHDPADKLAKQKLIVIAAQQLVYSIHEVPSGVLWGCDGASIEDCDELILSLADFQALVKDEPESEEYEQLINDCAFHYREYKSYLAQRDGHKSYAQYLSTIKNAAYMPKN